MNSQFLKKAGEEMRESLYGSDAPSQAPRKYSLSSGRILGEDVTKPDDIPEGARTPLGWKEAKRAADSKIITEMPQFKFGEK